MPSSLRAMASALRMRVGLRSASGGGGELEEDALQRGLVALAQRMGQVPDLVEGHHPSLVEDEHPLAGHGDLREDVGGEDDGVLPGEPLDQLAHLGALARVEALGCLLYTSDAADERSSVD